MGPSRPDVETKTASTTSRSTSSSTPLLFDANGIEALRAELAKLAATNQEIMKSFQGQPTPRVETESRPVIELPPIKDDLGVVQREVELLKQENDKLRKQLADSAVGRKPEIGGTGDNPLGDYERMLEEKTETIRALNMKIQMLQDELRGGPNGPTRQELDARQRDLEAFEARLREDEESLNCQAREMEMAMARERADLARQRSELQRLHEDVQREIDVAARDPGLRERLAALQRRPDGRPKTATSLSSITLPALPQPGSRPATMPALDLESDESIKHKPSLLRRIFGG